MKQLQIGIFVGSLRRASYSRMLAQEFSRLLADRFAVRLIDLSDLSMFNQDYDDDGNPPEAWERFRAQVRALDGFLFVTPEYNRSLPPLLKNALDIASRPYGLNCWSGKPGAVISVSPGKPGGFGANHHLRQTLSFLNVYTMQQPEAYVGNVDQMFDTEGKITNESSQKFLQSLADAFAAWAIRFTV